MGVVVYGRRRLRRRRRNKTVSIYRGQRELKRVHSRSSLYLLFLRGGWFMGTPY
jgi:hypothetical protein